MSAAIDTLKELSKLGVKATPNPERGTITLDPIDAVPAELREQIIANKPELIKCLQQRAEIIPINWHDFISGCVKAGATREELTEMFDESDRLGLAECPASQLPDFVRTTMVQIRMDRFNKCAVKS